METSEASLPPLHDLKVVDFSWAVAGPMIGRTLADYGATVVKVESLTRIDTARLIGPYHDGRRDPQNSALYGNCNAGKLGLSLNMAHGEAREVAGDLAEWADVLVESFSPGVMSRWGMDYDTLSARNPRLIMLSTSIMGQTGPYRQLSGAGNIGSAMSGFQHLTGWPDLPPFGPYGPYTDFVAPRFSLVLLLSALDQRSRSGNGAHLDISQAESAIHLLSPWISAYAADGVLTDRAGNSDLQLAPHGVYPCARLRNDEPGWIAIAVRDEHDWLALVALAGDGLNQPRFSSIGGRRRHAADLDELITAWTDPQDPHLLEKTLQAAGVPAHLAASSRAMYDDPQLRSYEHFVVVERSDTARGTIQRGPFHLADRARENTPVAPASGRDTRQVLCDLLGYPAARYEELLASGVLT